MKFIILFALLLLSSQLLAQESEGEFLRHRIGAVYGLTYVPEGYYESGDEENEKGILIAAYGLEYAYKLNEKWSLGIEFTLEGGNYLIKEDLPRDNSFKIVATGHYELIPFWEMYFGGGIELESDQNYGVIRVGTEYEFPIGNGWDLTPGLTFDYKIEYTSFEVAISVGKRF